MTSAIRPAMCLFFSRDRKSAFGPEKPNVVRNAVRGPLKPCKAALANLNEGCTAPSLTASEDQHLVGIESADGEFGDRVDVAGDHDRGSGKASGSTISACDSAIRQRRDTQRTRAGMHGADLYLVLG